jgi:hypothetical protein
VSRDRKNPPGVIAGMVVLLRQVDALINSVPSGGLQRCSHTQVVELFELVRKVVVFTQWLEGRLNPQIGCDEDGQIPVWAAPPEPPVEADTLWTKMIAALQTAEAAIDGPKQPCDSIVPDVQVMEAQRLMVKLVGFWNFVCTESKAVPGELPADPPELTQAGHTPSAFRETRDQILGRLMARLAQDYPNVELHDGDTIHLPGTDSSQIVFIDAARPGQPYLTVGSTSWPPGAPSMTLSNPLDHPGLEDLLYKTVEGNLRRQAARTRDGEAGHE